MLPNYHHPHYSSGLNDGERCRCCGTVSDYASDEFSGVCGTCATKLSWNGRKVLNDEAELSAALIHYLTRELNKISRGEMTGRCEAMSTIGRQCAHNASVMRDNRKVCRQHAARLTLTYTSNSIKELEPLRYLMTSIIQDNPQFRDCVKAALDAA